MVGEDQNIRSLSWNLSLFQRVVVAIGRLSRKSERQPRMRGPSFRRCHVFIHTQSEGDVGNGATLHGDVKAVLHEHEDQVESSWRQRPCLRTSRLPTNSPIVPIRSLRRGVGETADSFP